MSRAYLASTLAGCYLFSACSALGPKANVSMVSSELKTTKEVGNVMIPDVTGIDSTGNTGKALLGNAMKSYGMRSRPASAADAVLGTLGAPDGLSTLMTAAYSAEFIKLVANDKKKPEALKLPEFPQAAVPDGIEGVKQMVPKFKEEAAAIGEISKAIASGKSDELAASLDKSKAMMGMVQKMNEFMFGKLDVTYVLLTHVTGDEAAWNAGKKVKYCAALVNVKTGKLRYYATVEAKKGAVPVPFMAQLGVMASNLFDQVGEQDKLPEKKEKKEKKEKAKATAGLETNVTFY